ncbi:initiator tRNA phosphoribosyl transferase [Annulohypoxylon maeteangense]|uniref:initiator tRNA phosphoribosyl transferase n=1 Tax=Annulohypoxylon maeteangense TaxID=1927788 RepID=UPI002008BA46|nr:initiator tRNA phosphoribosyl transferase [Annulohypoxylon maeteangense]KAI0885155.1 initiator tRNA phosphoribosyl transferase [Annulohypoxylon maeteangense]
MATTAAELVFSPQANHNFSRILNDLKRSNLSITNRLRSIREDADFVSEVATAFSRPLIANERCGSWYISPETKAGSAYFKSTDGHTGQWRFSTRRLNLQLLSIIGSNDGCIIVDSTRRGKRMPDALSKTVPIWCCVLNRVLFPDTPAFHELHTPPNAVSESEHAQIDSRIPEHVDSLRALDINLDVLRQQVKKPLRPIWVTQDSQLVPTDEIFDEFHPVICCTSSRRVAGGEMSEGGYIQGAGDDTENWALGLTPPVFWRHADILLSTPEPDLSDLVRSLVSDETVNMSTTSPRKIAPCLSVSCLPLGASPPSTCVVAIYSKTTDPSSWVKSPLLMEVGVGKHKLASRNLRMALPAIGDFVRQFLERTSDLDASEDSDSSSPEPRQILIACETGKDISIGVALALLCQHFDSEGKVRPQPSPSGHTKSDIRVKLSRIMTNFPEANPSRTTLQSVNSYLMG